MKNLFSRPALLVFLGTAALLLAANRDFLFLTPWHETSDFAVNALQIERARHLSEIHGNYSRFHFHHPGPAFFYVYAAGEYLFHDWLRVVPAPHNAHVLSGLLLQAAFFAAALGIAAGWVRSRLFLPVALLLGGIHFRLAENAFTSIWPPHVLLMPCLCFLVAGASTAAGQVRHLPVTALAGCFLVHGHVAQVLIVVPLFLLALGACLHRLRGPGESLLAPCRRHGRPHALAAGCIGLFALPLFIDLAAGGESNLMTLVRYVSAGHGESKTAVQSLAYLLSFFAYFHQQDQFLPELGPGQPGFIWTRAAWYPAWLAMAGYVGFALFRPQAADRAGATHRFHLALVTIVAAGLVLSFGWGVMQIGPMFEFNSHFNYALIFAFLLLVAEAVSRALSVRGVLLSGAVLCAGGAFALWQGTRLPPSSNPVGADWIAATKVALQSDPQPSATKFLVFEHDDWGDVASTALGLQRLGASFRVSGNWAFMFGRDHSFLPATAEFDRHGMSVWRFSRGSHPGRQAQLPGDLRIDFDPDPLDPDGFVIDCSPGGNIGRFALFGFSDPAEDCVWTTLRVAALQFQSVPVDREVVFSLTARPFLSKGRISRQPMELFVNGRKVGAFVAEGLQQHSARIPAGLWNSQSPVTIELCFPAAASPLRLGLHRDPREFGWLIQRMDFALAEFR